MNYRACLLLALFAVGMWTGCDSADLRGGMAVRGEIILDGTPVPEGHISFEPTGTEGLSSGSLIRGGKYSISSEDGLPPGEYLVRIFADPQAGNGAATPPDVAPGMDGLLPTPPPQLIPPEYNAESTQKVTVTKEGPNKFDFKIQSKSE